MILVTGGTGLVGSHLLLRLVENGASVRALYRKLENIEKTKKIFAFHEKEALFSQINWIEADILDIPSLEKAFENTSFVYHCAALVSFDPKEESQIRKTNIEGTANIVNFCLAYSIKKLCYVSSIAALGDLKENESIITEDSEWNPEKSHSDYAISKYGAEMEIWRGQQEGLDAIIVNPGVILGPPFWNEGSGVFYQKIQNGFPFYTKGITGFVVVTDVVKIMHQLMNSEISHQRFILVANNLSFQELFILIAHKLNVKIPSIHINSLLMNILWRLDWFSSTFFRTKRKLDKETAFASYSKSLYSNEKIKKALKIDFMNISNYLKPQN